MAVLCCRGTCMQMHFLQLFFVVAINPYVAKSKGVITAVIVLQRDTSDLITVRTAACAQFTTAPACRAVAHTACCVAAYRPLSVCLLLLCAGSAPSRRAVESGLRAQAVHGW